VGTPSGVGVGAAPAGELPGTSVDGSSERADSTSAATPTNAQAIQANNAFQVFVVTTPISRDSTLRAPCGVAGRDR